MFFQKVTMKTYNQRSSDLFLGMTFQDWPELTCQEFAQWKDFSNKQGGTSFLDLALLDTVKLLSLALLDFVFSKPELQQKFQDKHRWSTPKISIYIRVVQKFLHTLMLLVHISGSLLAQAFKLETAKHTNSWHTHQRNIFLHPESSLFVLKLTYYKIFKISQQETKDAHFLFACVSHLILVYLALVLSFVEILEKKIQKVASQGDSPLLINILKRPRGTMDLSVTMSKYSQEFLGQ